MRTNLIRKKILSFACLLLVSNQWHLLPNFLRRTIPHTSYTVYLDIEQLVELNRNVNDVFMYIYILYVDNILNFNVLARSYNI